MAGPNDSRAIDYPVFCRPAETPVTVERIRLMYSAFFSSGLWRALRCPVFGGLRGRGKNGALRAFERASRLMWSAARASCVLRSVPKSKPMAGPPLEPLLPPQPFPVLFLAPSLLERPLLGQAGHREHAPFNCQQSRNVSSPIKPPTHCYQRNGS